MSEMQGNPSAKPPRALDSSKRPTIRDVAREAGVSITTVSRYLNQSSHIDQLTAESIRQAVEKLSYKPSIAAQSLRNKTGKLVLLIVPDICNPFYSQMARTVQHLLKERGYGMALFDTDETLHENDSIDFAKQMYASGILLASIDIKESVIRKVVESGIPTVALNAFDQYPFDAVHVHNSEGCYLSTKLLITLGHKRIGFAGGTPNSMIGNSRREGYLRAMHDAKLPVNEEYMLEIGFSQHDGYEAGRYFSKLNPLPTAICCANDQIALGLLAAMQERKISIPGEVSVTGMDDVPYSKISNPSLTSVTNDSKLFAKEGVRMLFERIEGIVTGKPRDVIVRHELIVRDSVSYPRDRE